MSELCELCFTHADINECDIGIHTCVNAMCNNTDGGFNCICNDGFRKLEETDDNCSKYSSMLMSMIGGGGGGGGA